MSRRRPFQRPITLVVTAPLLTSLWPYFRQSCRLVGSEQLNKPKEHAVALFNIDVKSLTKVIEKAANSQKCNVSALLRAAKENSEIHFSQFRKRTTAMTCLLLSDTNWCVFPLQHDLGSSLLSHAHFGAFEATQERKLVSSK